MIFYKTDFKPLEENIFTNGKPVKKPEIKKWELVTFHYKIVVDEGKSSISTDQTKKFTADFALKK